MNDRVNGGMLGEDIVESLFVGDVDLVEVWATAGDELDTVEGNLGGVVEVVDNDDVVAVLEKSEGRERANVARSAKSITLGMAVERRRTVSCHCRRAKRDRGRKL